ncbi:MAG: magnesium transporter [Candidatus Omnitrophota bacterium]|nr:magnesium transporter [Candidatus Omnitrophota bacterium]MBU1894221.1 magnesium transporter [Candidatus Omnitrophota bacterium]
MKNNKEFWNREKAIKSIENFLKESLDANLETFLKSTKPEDVAEILGEFSSKEKIRIFNALPAENAAVVLDDTDPQTRLQILQKIDNDKLAKVLDEMPADEAADVVEEVPEENREEILDLMEEKDAEEVEEILSYPEDSAGRVMNPEFIFVRENNDVEDAVQHMRNFEVEEKFIYVYVVDENMKLQGAVTIWKLLTANKGTLIKDIVEREIHSILVDGDQEKAALIMKKYDLFSLPVINNEGCLVGRITVDDIMDVVDEEHAEDISRMTGTIEEEQGTETTLKATQNRLPWLITCMLGSIVTGLVIQHYEVTLAETIALVSFIPVITATGGNSGVQASTVVVRGIALGHRVYAHVMEEVWRQLKIALGLGLICGTVLTFLANIWMKNSLVGIIVGLSIFLVVVWSNFVGVVIPVVFEKMRIDPAIASGPLITTLNDVVGVFIYLTIASIFLA